MRVLFVGPFIAAERDMVSVLKKINIFFKHLIWTFKGVLLLSRNCNNYFQGGFPPWLLKDYTTNYMPRFRTMKNAGKWPQMLLSFNLIGVIKCFVHLCLSGRHYFLFSHRCYKFFMLVVLPLLCFLSLALALCRSFPGWASLACRLLSLFLCFSLSLYSKLADVIINLSLIL